MKYETRRKLIKIFKNFYLSYEQHILKRAEEIQEYQKVDDEKLREEYEKKMEMLRIRANRQGEYDVIVYDIKNSRETRYDILSLSLLFNDVASEIKKLEKKRRMIILRRCPDSVKDKRIYNSRGFYTFSDLFAITVYHGTITLEEMNSIVKKHKKMRKIRHDFHYYMQSYETEEYEESNEKYYLDYAIQYAEEASKLKDDVI